MSYLDNNTFQIEVLESYEPLTCRLSTYRLHREAEEKNSSFRPPSLGYEMLLMNNNSPWQVVTASLDFMLTSMYRDDGPFRLMSYMKRTYVRRNVCVCVCDLEAMGDIYWKLWYLC